MDAKSWSAVVADHAVHGLTLSKLIKEEDVPKVLGIIADEIHHRLSLRDEPQPLVSQAEQDDAALARGIERTLQSLTFVTRLSVHFPVSKPGFWERCRLLTPNWRWSRPQQIFVDGYVGCCKWNCVKVFTEAREAGLSLWSGYAYAGFWAKHFWCMLGERFVETGAPFRIYYGAQLDETEIAELANESEDFADKARQKKKLPVWTIVNGGRDTVRYDDDKYGQSIGRERDLTTGAIKEGLGR